MLLSMIQNIKHISWNFLFGNWCSVGIYAIGISHKIDEIWFRFSNDEIYVSLDLYHITLAETTLHMVKFLLIINIIYISRGCL